MRCTVSVSFVSIGMLTSSLFHYDLFLQASSLRYRTEPSGTRPLAGHWARSPDALLPRQVRNGDQMARDSKERETSKERRVHTVPAHSRRRSDSLPLRGPPALLICCVCMLTSHPFASSTCSVHAIARTQEHHARSAAYWAVAWRSQLDRARRDVDGGATLKRGGATSSWT